MHAEMGSVGAKRAACSHLSGRFSGLCILDEQCEINCEIESEDNIGGACDGFPSRCYCQTQCPPWSIWSRLLQQLLLPFFRAPLRSSKSSLLGLCTIIIIKSAGCVPTGSLHACCDKLNKIVGLVWIKKNEFGFFLSSSIEQSSQNPACCRWHQQAASLSFLKVIEK